MRPVFQTTFKGTVAGEETGNCLAACVASILELPIEDVPNFAAIEGENEWWVAMQEFVSKHGFYIYPVAQELGAPEGCYYIAVGKSPRGSFNHCVVAMGAEVVHDPRPDAEGPALDGYAKELYLFVARDAGKHLSALREIRKFPEGWKDRGSISDFIDATLSESS